MKIAICDDNLRDLKHLLDLVEESSLCPEIKCFSSAEGLLDVSRNGARFDVIFLDIEMDNINGYEAAQQLIEYGNSPLIVFVTISSKYVYDGYEVAWRYIPKPIDRKQVQKLITDAQKIIEPKIITLEATDGLKTLNLNDIIYAEIKHNLLQIHTTNGCEAAYLPLSEFEKQLDPIRFAKPHVSFLVNYAFISSVKKNEIILKEGYIIPLARSRKDQFWQTTLGACRNGFI